MRPSIKDVRAVADFATTYQWEMRFLNAPTIGQYPTIAELNLRCASVVPPRMSIDRMNVRVRGHKVQQSAMQTYSDDFTISFYETVDAKALRFMREWREACVQTNTGVLNNKVDCEATVKLLQLDRQDNAIYEMTVFGCMFADTDLGEFNEEGTDPRRLEFTISYDFFEDRVLT